MFWVVRSLLVPFPPRIVLAICALAWVAAACASGDASDALEPQYGTGSDYGLPNAPTDITPDSGRTDGAAHTDGAVHVEDVSAPAAPAAPSCHAGDRNEWSGIIPNTAIALSVCSTCGESYVVASNGSASPGEVSVDNGKATITASVPASGIATTAKLADDPTNGTVSVCGTSGSHGCLPVAPQNRRYCNPYRAVTGLVPQRIDQGVDYGGGGPIYALGPGIIDVYHNRDDYGWPGQTFVSYKLSAGPAAGQVVYLAENVDLNPALHSGSFVFSGTVLGTLVDADPYSESGWGVVGQAITGEYSCYTEGCATALGIDFNALLVCLHAPSGIIYASGCCSPPARSHAEWCGLLASWQ
jgi:hypothetical protein